MKIWIILNLRHLIFLKKRRSFYVVIITSMFSDTMQWFALYQSLVPGILCCDWLAPFVPPFPLLLMPFVFAFSLLFVGSPPSKGDMWLSDTCSINDVPYFLKYHHSNICNIQVLFVIILCRLQKVSFNMMDRLVPIMQYNVWHI